VAGKSRGSESRQGKGSSTSLENQETTEVGPQCPNKTAARDPVREFLELINLARNIPESVMSLIRFTEDRYLPFVEEHKRTSTFRGYRNMWRLYLKPRGDIQAA